MIIGCASGSSHVGARRVGLPGDAHVLRVIGHPHEVERRVDLDVEAHGMLDRLALRVLQRLGGTGQAVAHHPRVDQPAGMDMLLAEIGISLGVGLVEDALG